MKILQSILLLLALVTASYAANEKISSFPDATLPPGPTDTITGLQGGVNVNFPATVGNTVSLTAGTNIAAGTAVSINTSGQAVQTWGTSPNVANITQLFGGLPLAVNSPYKSVLLTLSASQFVVFDTNSGDPGYGAQACSIALEVISCGSIDTSTISQSVQPLSTPLAPATPTAFGLTSTDFVAAYDDPMNANNFTVAIGSITANAISYGTPVQVASQGLSSPGKVDVAILSSTEFVIGYTLCDQTSWVVAGTVSGTTITLGTPVELTTSEGPSVPQVATLSTTSFLASFTDSNSSNIGTLTVATVSGTVITLNSATTIPGSSSIFVTLLSPTSFVVTELRSLNEIFAGSISGTTITVGSGIPVSGAASKFSTTKALVGLNIYSVSGTTVSLSSTSALPYNLSYPNAASVNTPANVVQSSNVAIVNNSTAVVIDNIFSIYEMDTNGLISPPFRHQLLVGYWVYTLDSTHVLATLFDLSGVESARVITINPISSLPVGFSESMCSSSSSCRLTLSGISSGFSGLSIGTQYYINGDGTLTTANSGHPAGVALSSSTILIGGQ